MINVSLPVKHPWLVFGFTLILANSIITACVSVKMPDHMVSDTVEAGKDAYKSIKESISDDEEDEPGFVSFQYTTDTHTDVEQAKQNCVVNAQVKAKHTLKINPVQSVTVMEKVEFVDDSMQVECKIQILNQDV